MVTHPHLSKAVKRDLQSPTLSPTLNLNVAMLPVVIVGERAGISSTVWGGNDDIFRPRLRATDREGRRRADMATCAHHGLGMDTLRARRRASQDGELLDGTRVLQQASGAGLHLRKFRISISSMKFNVQDGRRKDPRITGLAHLGIEARPLAGKNSLAPAADRNASFPQAAVAALPRRAMALAPRNMIEDIRNVSGDPSDFYAPSPPLSLRGACRAR